jgi:hypothetical protein|tara:strand:- start:1010 stop:1189 length:180 start_codon:yes stop_codon:yes gene_type:complete
MAGFGDIVVGYLFNEDMKKEIVDKINDDINIPLIKESTEEKVFTAILNIVEDVARKVLK